MFCLDDFLCYFRDLLEDPLAVNEVEGLEGQEELCFINNNGSWYKKEPNFQYNNYQQKSYPNNQQSGHPPRNNQQGSYQPQQNPSSGSSAPQESSTDTLLKQILESQTRSEKHVGYELKNLHSKINGSYNELNNKFSHLASTLTGILLHLWTELNLHSIELRLVHVVDVTEERIQIDMDSRKPLKFQERSALWKGMRLLSKLRMIDSSNIAPIVESSHMRCHPARKRVDISPKPAQKNESLLRDDTKNDHDFANS
ncbi:hypothetical protein IGI04_034845 [Brassica rapa subsp. trilocularis]|uniref:Uncharacterized protein n=1 Tax=Brassica rapa subsp. trilocularis TaxID=1813537 RepID=A0ABQ7LBW3_BRACM|nr:hypothetical protein IGI04_034845 [Brassica rapa subsp. trilocularis]